ncbi:MAG TPA: glycosyl hydrolase [Gemmatimonadaceae bacterium]|nr:glycosyl hydrolase [Gemmatimonadaceae bacterium]
MFASRITIAAAVFFASAWSLAAQQQAAATPIDPELARRFQWRGIGPDRGGRSIAVSGVRGRPREAYFGAVGGGLWKTTDGGESWAPVTDGQVTSASVGAIAVSESNPDVVYIGMGESCIRGNIMPGDGIYKSTDAGKTWTHMGFRTADAVSRIRVHPTNPDIVYAALFGKYGVQSEERGVFKSTDGGRTWRKVLYRDAKTGAVDLSIDPSNPNVMYAALWEAYRVEYQMSSGGPGSGLFKSIDGGETWTEITRNTGMPSGLIGRIGVAVSGADPNRVYALVENDNGGLFSSDNAGATWTLVNSNRNIRQRAFYYTHIAADPKAKETVYMLNVSAYRSTDGGKTINNLGGDTHGDFHDLWIDPDNADHLVIGNDGGGAVSTSATAPNWTDQDIPTPQYYHVVTTKHMPYHVCGAQQDGSTVCVSNLNPSNGGGGARGAGGGRGGRGGGGGGGGRGGAAVPEPYGAGGSEAGYIAPDPKDLDVFFAGGVNGTFMTRINRRTGERREMNPYPRMYHGEPSIEIRERWQWTYPIIFSPVDPNILYTSSQRLWKTTNGGQTWQAISGDLTRHDPKTMQRSGGPITGDMNGPEVYGTIFAIAPSKRDVNVIWTGSDDGVIHVTRDGGRTWTNVTPPGMPEFGRVSIIDASSFETGRAYAAVKRQLLDDRAPYIFRTTDFGRTWTKITNGIPANHYVHTVREDPTRRGLLYAGTQQGVQVSYDDGATWQSLSLNLPSVPVSDMIVEANDLVISTHGRGFYVLDDIAPIRQFSAAVAAEPAAVLFKPEPAVRSVGGATFTYWLKRPAQSLKFEVLDATGTVVTTMEAPAPNAAGAGRGEGGRGGGGGGGGGGEGGRGGRGGGGGGPSMVAGLNSVSWNLQYPGATTFPGMILWGASTAGPMAAPGEYTVRMTADGRAQTQTFSVVRHPLFTATDADLRAQFNLAIRIRDKLTEANNAVIEIRAIEQQVADRLSKSTDDRLRAAGATLSRNLDVVEDSIYQVRNQSGQDPLNYPIRVNNRLGTLLRSVTTGDGAPIGNAEAIFTDLIGELKVHTDKLSQVLRVDLPALNVELARLGLERVSIGPRM